MLTHRLQITMRTTRKLLRKQTMGKASKVTEKLHDALALMTLIPVTTINDITGIMIYMVAITTFSKYTMD